MASTLTKAKKLHVADVIIWEDETVAIIDIDTKADPKCVYVSVTKFGILYLPPNALVPRIHA